jgi:hypothetical protein
VPTLIVLTVVIASLSAEPVPVISRTPLLLQTLKAPRLHPVNPLGRDPGIDSAANRIFLEFLAGAVLGGVSGGLTGWAMGSTLESPASLVVPSSVLLLGSSVGVALVGNLMEGRGRFSYAMLGGTLGSVVPLTVGLGLMRLVNCTDYVGNGCVRPMVVGLIGFLVLPAVGAIVGYELSAPKSWLWVARAEKLPAPRQVVPVVTLARQGLGGTVGLAWTL